MMESIVLNDDELRLLEGRFGPQVRQMGSWSSDGTFGYSCVPMVAVQKAADAFHNASLMVALTRLEHTPERTQPFIELLETYGTVLIERIVAAYKERSQEMLRELALSQLPPMRR